MRYVYVLRNLVNDKVYIGQTKNPRQRKSAHFFNARKGFDKPLYRSIRKHGEENFLFEIIEECEDTLINERERYWVSHYDSFNSENGYNLTSGGNQGTEVSQQTREKIGNYWRGRKHTKEHIENRANSLRGKKRSESQRLKMSKARKGKGGGGWHGNEDTPNRISESLKRKWADSNYRNKMSNHLSHASLCAAKVREKPVQKIDEKGNVLETFSSIKEASQLTGIKNITSVCKGRRPKAGRYFWRYA